MVVYVQVWLIITFVYQFQKANKYYIPRILSHHVNITGYLSEFGLNIKLNLFWMKRNTEHSTCVDMKLRGNINDWIK